ncbi:MAG: DUF374 domain-containing protein [Deltaproteobacteria bacterium]|nr:DUF374 domain-containing protein [Deltaproteobacteria bacterium]
MPPAATVTWRQRGRALRFAALERGLLPLGVPPLRAALRSWRVADHPHSPASLTEVAAAPRVVIGTCHGMLLHILALHQLPFARWRRVVVLLSPSLDGRLLAAFLARFGVDHAIGTSGSRGVGGAHAFARRVAAGDLGVVAVDGPRGPRARMTPGWLRLAQAADASAYLVVTAAAPGVTFNSWDRAHLPAPFARLSSWSAPLPTDIEIEPAQARLDRALRALGMSDER